ncbi:hypothetical protein DTL21_05965 [Bremerella cremea]|uniref:Uncharacterized protein n=1 Tax=Blastopirellula marina TaxID=124 RepID=A0A2S8FZ61_9BACT|nr:MULTISPECIES: hypothetical protein [Pirellulaceae]PQO37487.1 hypothetical protein C5Y83_05965 [Blastopirellula marina]RCS49874.1 hypothetical protein DTL21_05965 [Bremerella cremea]
MMPASSWTKTKWAACVIGLVIFASAMTLLLWKADHLRFVILFTFYDDRIARLYDLTPPTDFPDGWKQLSVSSVSVMLPNSRSVTKHCPDDPWMQAWAVEFDGCRAIDIVTTDGDATAIDEMSQLLKVSPKELPNRVLALKAEAFRTTVDEFRWDMSRKELDLLEFKLLHKNVRLGYDNETEFYFYETPLFDGFLFYGSEYPRFVWISHDLHYQGQIYFYEFPKSDIETVLSICGSLQINASDSANETSLVGDFRTVKVDALNDSKIRDEPGEIRVDLH